MAQIDFEARVLNAKRTPDFENLLSVLRRQRPSRPTLFEFFLNEALYAYLVGREAASDAPYDRLRHQIAAYARAGYDYCTVAGDWVGFSFPRKAQAHDRTVSLNEGVMISDRASFQAYPWPDPDALDYSLLDQLARDLPGGMKLISYGPFGVLENVVALAGYENLCMLLADDAELAQDLFAAVGSRMLRYYQRCLEHKTVGAIVSNDDWGFKTQTMFSPPDMRKYVLPWHRKIVAAAHAAGKPAILHSCGQLQAVMDDIIDDLKFDAKHSYEDTILPVEQAYDHWGGRIAILGGIDMDFICRSQPRQVYERSRAMLQLAAERGGYALGTGNSVAGYVPQANYFAMTAAAYD